MFNRRELCNLKDPHEAELLVEIAGISLANSEYTLREGFPSSHYFDLDNYLCKIGSAENLSQLIADKLDMLSASEELIYDKIAFVEKGEGGPVGLISIMGLVCSKIGKEAIIVRPSKQLERSTIKGLVSRNDRMLIINDVATTGRTIFNSAQKIWAHGAKVPYSLVVFDRLQGATENLSRKGIQLFSLTSAKSLQEEKEADLREKFKRSIKTDFEPNLIDFGGVSITATT